MSSVHLITVLVTKARGGPTVVTQSLFPINMHRTVQDPTSRLAGWEPTSL